MPDFDPSQNGHRVRAQQQQIAESRRGGAVLLVTLVSALTGLNMMIGGAIGAIVGTVTKAGEATAAVAAVGAGIGGGIGVFLGVRVALRLGGSGGVASARALTAWGLVGLVGSVALAATVATVFTPFAAILLPGLAVVLGDRIATKRKLARAGQKAEKVKLRDQEKAAE